MVRVTGSIPVPPTIPYESLLFPTMASRTRFPTVPAYVYSLFVEVQAPTKLPDIQKYLLDALQNSWSGKTFDKDKVNELAAKPEDLLDTLAVCDRLAPILETAPTINGNPPIIKRLLNAKTLRQSLSVDRGMNVGLATLAKLAVDSQFSQFNVCCNHHLLRLLVPS